MSKCAQCFAETGSSNALCPACRRQNAELSGAKQIAQSLLREHQQASSRQNDSYNEQAARNLEAVREASERAAREQEESNQRLLDEQRRLADLKHRQEQIRLQETKEMYKEAHLNSIKIKLLECSIASNENGVGILLNSTDVRSNLEFFWQDIISNKMLKSEFFKSFLNQNRKHFSHTKLFKGDELNKTEYDFLFKKFFEYTNNEFPNRLITWNVGRGLYDSDKNYEYSEAFWKLLYDLSLEEARYTRDPATCRCLVAYSMAFGKKSRITEAISYLKAFASSNEITKVAWTYYTLAKLSCMNNELQNAKMYIDKHFEQDSECIGDRNITFALCDDTLSSIKAHLEKIKEDQDKANEIAKQKKAKEDEKRHIELKKQKARDNRHARFNQVKRAFSRFFTAVSYIAETALVLFYSNFLATSLTLDYEHRLYLLGLTFVSFIIVNIIAYLKRDKYHYCPSYGQSSFLMSVLRIIMMPFKYVFQIILNSLLRGFFTFVLLIVGFLAFFICKAIHQSFF